MAGELQRVWRPRGEDRRHGLELPAAAADGEPVRVPGIYVQGIGSARARAVVWNGRPRDLGRDAEWNLRRAGARVCARVRTVRAEQDYLPFRRLELWAGDSRRRHAGGPDLSDGERQPPAEGTHKPGDALRGEL